MKTQNTALWTLGFCLLATCPVRSQTAVDIRGKVTDSSGTPIAAATVKLERLGNSAVSASDGSFILSSATGIRHDRPSRVRALSIRENRLHLELSRPSQVSVTSTGIQGQVIATSETYLESGSRTLGLPPMPAGLCFFRVSVDGEETLLRALSVDGHLRLVSAGQAGLSPGMALRKGSAAAIYDVLIAEKAGFQKAYVAMNNSDSNGVNIKMLKEGTTKFSFFVVSMKAIVEQSGNADGFGGDLRFGETGPGAGLRGADKICRTVAETSLPGSSVKGWRAFMSVTADAQGRQVNAINRVGPGPWYDRLGRVMAPTKADLVAVRPKNADPAIQLDLPNEFGVPNHRPDPSKPADDNHHMMTGSDTSGNLKSATATCKDWTVAEANSAHGKPAVGFAWPRGGRVTSQGSHWMATYEAHGCGRGFGIIEDGPGNPSILTVGDGGGYGGFYCFALNP